MHELDKSACILQTPYCVVPIDLYFYRHHNKPLDLNNLFRYTNLPQNAKLEMVPTDRRRTESMTVYLGLGNGRLTYHLYRC